LYLEVLRRTGLAMQAICINKPVDSVTVPGTEACYNGKVEFDMADGKLIYG